MSDLRRRVGQLADPFKWRYLLSGVRKRFWQPKRCPSCGSADSTPIGRKFVYSLERCSQCRLLFKYPAETGTEMARYYQEEYSQVNGLVSTRVPSDAELAELVNNNFEGTGLHFGNVLELFRQLGIPSGARVLDVGASWGFGTLQLRRAGFDAIGFEISRPRAELGRRLGVSVVESLAEAGSSFDVVYSSHVLEHLPDPRASLREQLALTRPGGFVVAHTPNGSEAFRRANPRLFHLLWGLSHPVLTSDEWVRHNWPDLPTFQSSGQDRHRPPELGQWDRRSRFTGDVSRPELLIVLRRAGGVCT